MNGDKTLLIYRASIVIDDREDASIWVKISRAALWRRGLRERGKGCGTGYKNDAGFYGFHDFLSRNSSLIPPWRMRKNRWLSAKAEICCSP